MIRKGIRVVVGCMRKETERVMRLGLKHKTALVTGGSRGIGKGCALALAQAGANVVVNYRSDREAAEETVRLITESGASGFAYETDVSDRQQVAAMVDEAVNRFGSIDILVANAAASTRDRFLHTNIDELRRTMDVTFYGNFHPCQIVAQAMVDQAVKGSIIVIGSIHAVYPLENAFDYNVAKAALHHMTMTMANELSEHHIRVNLLVPGWIDTPGERKWTEEEVLYAQGKALPWGRLGSPKDIGKAAVYLSSEAAGYVSGSVLTVDGALGVSMPKGGSSDVREGSS